MIGCLTDLKKLICLSEALRTGPRPGRHHQSGRGRALAGTSGTAAHSSCQPAAALRASGMACVGKARHEPNFVRILFGGAEPAQVLP